MNIDRDMQFPLYKLFFITAAYAAALGPLCYMGTYGILLAVAIGTAGSAFILAFRAEDLTAVGTAIVGTLVGASPGLLMTSARWGSYYETFAERVVGDTIPVAIGGLAGALIFSFVAKRRTK